MPANRAIVFGAAIVWANVADNVGVAVVQFLLDGEFQRPKMLPNPETDTRRSVALTTNLWIHLIVTWQSSGVSGEIRIYNSLFSATGIQTRLERAR